MKKAIMVVHDILGEKYVQPHITETVEIAIRDFMEAASDEKKETTLAKYPQDYDLLHCGYFDPQTGEVEPIAPRTALQGKHIGQKKGVEKKDRQPNKGVQAVN